MREMGAAQQTTALAAERPEGNIARFGWLAFLGAGASMLSCYIKKLGDAMAPLGAAPEISLNPHVQAVFMWGFALVATIAIARDRRSHGHNLPLAVSRGRLPF